MEIIIKEDAEKMLNNKLGQGQFLRVIVIEGGCAGLTYNAEIAKEMRAGETVIRQDRKSTRLNSSHTDISRMPSSA